MQGNRLDDRIGQPPESQQVGTDLCMARARYSPLALHQWQALGARKFDCQPTLLRTLLDQDPVSDNVNQPGEPCIIRRGPASAERFAGRRGALRVVLQSFRVDFRETFRSTPLRKNL